MTITFKNLGEGIYSATDAHRILGLPFAKTKYWFEYYAKHKLFGSVGHQYHFTVKDTVAVNFLSLIEMYVFFALKENKIKTQTIVQAHKTMAEILNTPYPFAKEDIYIGKELVFDNKGTLITADKSQSLVISEFIKSQSKKITFDDKRLAHKFYPLGKDRTVVVNPQNQFGQPIIEGTNILSETLYNLYLGGDSKEFIAKLYNITPQNVIDAIEFSKAA